MLMVITTVRWISKEAGGIMLAILPIPMVCFKEEFIKESRGRHLEVKITP